MANVLEKAGIDLVMLEARARFDFQVGASIKLGPGLSQRWKIDHASFAGVPAGSSKVNM
jgi:hypothetical protein